MKATEQYFPVALFIMLYKELQNFKYVNKSQNVHVTIQIFMRFTIFCKRTKSLDFFFEEFITTPVQSYFSFIDTRSCKEIIGVQRMKSRIVPWSVS